MMKIGVAMVAIALLGFASSATAGESCGFMRSLISSTFGSHEDVWMCIAFHESSFNPDARNPFSGATGLFQVRDARTSPWSCSRWAREPGGGSMNPTREVHVDLCRYALFTDGYLLCVPPAATGRTHPLR